MPAIGHIWDVRPEVNPAVITATAFEHHMERRVLHVQMPHWAINYASTPGLRHKAHDINAPWQTREPDSIYLYSPRTECWEDYGGMGDGPSRGAYMVFQGGVELGLGHILQPFNDYAVIFDPYDTIKALLSEAATAAHELGDAAFPKVQAILWQLASELSYCKPIGNDRFRIEKPTGDKTEQSLVEAVDAYLRENISQRVTLDDLARHLCLSPSAVSHHYKKVKGQSPIAYLIAIRIQHAKGLLLRGYPLKIIAAQTGFRDAFHLSHTFKQHIGVSPKEYVKALASTESISHEFACKTSKILYVLSSNGHRAPASARPN